MLYDLWKSRKTGIYFLFDYTPKSQFMKKGKNDDFDGTTINFKMYNTGAKEFSEIIQALKEIFKAEISIGIPPATAEDNNIQRICDKDIYFESTKERKKRHKTTIKLNVKKETDRLKIKRTRKKINRAILCDDIATTGHTMNIYSKIALNAGAGEIIPFAIAHKKTPKTYQHGIYLTEKQDTYDLKRIAELLSLSQRRVQQLVKDRVLPRPNKREFDMAGCVFGYVKFLRDRAGGNGDLSLNEERARLAAAQANLQELKIAELKGELIPADKIAETWSRIITAAKMQFLALPDRLAQMLETASTANARRIIIDAEIKNILEALADGK